MSISDRELIGIAREAMKKAYAPYSGYKVGAALLSLSGKVYTGCNIENAAFTPTNCAERTAFFKAVSEGERNFLKIAVCGGKDGVISGYFPPCGVCRQVMVEFCNPSEFVVILDGGDEAGCKSLLLSDLLPYGFSNSNMN